MEGTDDFKVGDRVQIDASYHPTHGKFGYVVQVKGRRIYIELDEKWNPGNREDYCKSGHGVIADSSVLIKIRSKQRQPLMARLIKTKEEK